MKVSSERALKKRNRESGPGSPELGFSFIAADRGDELFFHISEIRAPARASMPYPRLTYRSVRVSKGLRAIDIEIVSRT